MQMIADPDGNNSSNVLNPVFIIGVPRSGTTLLRVILDSHSKIAAAPETPWILGGYGKYSIRELARYLSENYLGPVKNLMGESEAVILEGIRGMLHIIFSAYLQKRNKEILVLKTPDDIRYIDFLMKLYPRSRYIHIFRDGRDVACSTVKNKAQLEILHDYGEITYENAMQRWQDWERKIRSIFRDGGLFSYVRISYEDLVMHPEVTMRKVCEGIGMTYEKDMLDYAKFEHEYPEWEAGSADVKNRPLIEPSALGKWESQLSRDVLAGIEAVHGDFLKELGYELGTGIEEREKASRDMAVIAKDRGIRELYRNIQEKDKEIVHLSQKLEEVQKALNSVSLSDEAVRKLNDLNGMVANLFSDKEQGRQLEETTKEWGRQLEETTKEWGRQLEETTKERDEKFFKKCEELLEVKRGYEEKCMEVVTKDQELIRLRQELLTEKEVLKKEIQKRGERIQEIVDSYSWKMTSPFRALLGLFRKNR